MSERVAYLGPEGTFSEEALLASTKGQSIEPVAQPTIRHAVMAVQERTVARALVPIENSIEGPLTVTLDTLTGEAEHVEIVGESVLAVRHCLIGALGAQLRRIATVFSHPHVPGQCTRFLHEQLPSAHVEATSSTAEAVRLVAERKDPSCAAIGARLAAELYGCHVLCDGIQDRDDNETRFVWLARADAARADAAIGDRRAKDTAPLGDPSVREGHATREGHAAREGDAARADDSVARTGGATANRTAPASKTSLVFWGAGADRAGWLVLCLSEFAKRDINLTKIESRPRREQLGHYMFFVDLEGSVDDEAVRDALAGLRPLCEEVRVLGSYPAA